MPFLADEEKPGQELVTDHDLPARVMTTAQFRARQFFHSLTPAERNAVANRPRFYSMPYLRQSNEPTDDFLP